ncbi:MAG: response regulator [Candidatus Lokiarchaeota archaeon]|nr:response regulator [Candidatus Lokiarchaeota archaeon]
MSNEKIPPFDEIWKEIPSSKREEKFNISKFISEESSTINDWIKSIIEKVDKEKKKKCILIVDDEQTILDSLKKLLEIGGYAVEAATNGISALDILSKKEINLILSDVRMPAMDGMELFKECKSNPELNKIPFILFSAYYNEDTLQADYFLTKPIESGLLFKIIKKFL